MNKHFFPSALFFLTSLTIAQAEIVFGSEPVKKNGSAANLAFVNEKILPLDVWKVRLGMTREELQQARPGLSVEGDRGLRGSVFSEEIASTTHLYHYLGYTFGKTGLTHFDVSSGVWPHSKQQIIATVAWLQETFGDPTESFLMNLTPKTPESEGIAFVWQTSNATVGVTFSVSSFRGNSTLRVFPKGTTAKSMFDTSAATSFPPAEAVSQITKWADEIKWPET